MKFITKCLGVLATALVFASCGGGGSAGVGEGTFTLIEFLEAGKDSIPRNRILTFRFSAPVADVQDFFERLKIENVQTGANSNFSRAIGVYLVTGDEVTFVPRLPEKADRSDSGLRKNGQYVVFLKGGPDALTSTGGDRIATPQEFLFDTNENFEDPIPSEPPRALGMVARDLTTGDTFDISRIDPSPTTLAAQDNATLIAAGRVIEPGAGGGPTFDKPWAFDLVISEPLDPATIKVSNVEMFEIFADATNTGETAAPGAPAGTFGTPVNFRVPVSIKAFQTVAADGSAFIAIRVTPLFALVDNTRYRIRLSGNILGIDYRKSFIGENGLTGDGLTVPEPGGIGYTSEFIVRDRAAIQGTRTITFDPLEDGVNPEAGQTTNLESLFNTALYNPASSPGTAVGFLPDFGDGRDGPLAASGNGVTTLDTGDTPNDFIGNPFTVEDPNPDDEYNKTTLTTTTVEYDSPEYFDLNLESLVVSGAATLRVTGVNPILFRVVGLVQINGTLDVSGGDGDDGFGGLALGGVAGAGGGKGGDAKNGFACVKSSSACDAWATFLNSCSSIKSAGPFSKAGEGPGRGQPGGEAWAYAYDEILNGLTGTGGGGGSHATAGTAGEDRRNVGGAAGTPGPACASGNTSTSPGANWAKNSSVIGLRGIAGPTYGERTISDILWGGSGGAAGGTQHSYGAWGGSGQRSGGAGGGGGGSLAIFASGPIIASGGVVDVSGGDGGKGSLANGYNSQPTWRQASGAGGGGSGGSLVLISGASITVTAAILDARGGTGGDRASVGTTVTCGACNAGGDGGKGFIFLMDPDGVIEGLIPAVTGEYDSYANGILTISDFKGGRRFGSPAAITELFGVLSANPEYLPFSTTDFAGTVADGQAIRIFMSSARADTEDPRIPDLTSEIGAIEMALIFYDGGTITTSVTGDAGALNPSGTPLRDSYVRIDARFEYEDIVQAALGPFALIDLVIIRSQFNG